MLVPAPGALGDSLGHTKGISGLPVDPLEDMRAPNLCTHTHEPGMPYLPLSLEGANPEPSGHPPAETRMKARLCPARTNTIPQPQCPSHAGLPTLLPPTLPWLPAQEGLALGRKSQYPPIPIPYLVKIWGIPHNHKSLDTGIPCPNAGSNRSRVFSPQLACLGAWNITVKSVLPPTLASPGTMF